MLQVQVGFPTLRIINVALKIDLAFEFCVFFYEVPFLKCHYTLDSGLSYPMSVLAYSAAPFTHVEVRLSATSDGTGSQI